MLVALAVGCGTGATDAPTAAAPPVSVKTLVVSADSLERTASAVGTVEAARTAELTAEAVGTVVAVDFDDGAAVARGQRLVQLRDDGARADLRAAEATAMLAERRLERLRTLRAGDNASAEELDTAEAEVALAHAGVARARDVLDRTVVRAPFAGVLGRRLVEVGDLAAPGRAVARIEDITSVTVDAALPERWIPDLVVGRAVNVRIDALPGEALLGALVYVGPRLDADTRTVPVRARVENPGGRLRPGMTARLEVVVGEDAAVVLIPSQAVQPTPSGPSVYVVAADGTAERRPVRLGARRDADVEVVDGLKPGERLVVEGLVRLRPGAAVTETP